MSDQVFVQDLSRNPDKLLKERVLQDVALLLERECFYNQTVSDIAENSNSQAELLGEVRDLRGSDGKQRDRFFSELS